MRQILVVTVASLVYATSIGSVAAMHGPRHPGSATSLTISISRATKALDLGGQMDVRPDNWNQLGFDDSAWQERARPVSQSVVSCLRQLVPNWDNAPTYWGADAHGYYLFRQTFTLPNAGSFDGSTIDLGSPTGAGVSGDPHGTYTVYLNGAQIDAWQMQSLRRDAIGANLHPGSNALAIYAPPSNDLTTTAAQCSSFSFTMHIRANGSLPAPQSPPHTAPLTVLLPGANAVVTGPEIPFTWRPYHGAAYYDLQIWLVKADQGQRLSSASLTNYSARLKGTRFTLSNKRMLKGAYHWRMAAANAQGALISPWTRDASVTIPNV